MTDELKQAGRTRQPWYSPRNVVLGLVVVLALVMGYVLLETVALMNAEPNPSHDYRADYLAMLESSAGIDPERADASWRILMEVATELAERENEVHRRLEQTFETGAYIHRFPGDEQYLLFQFAQFGPQLSPLLDREQAFIEEAERDGLFVRLDEVVEHAPAVSNDPTTRNLLFSTDKSLRPLSALVRQLVFHLRMAVEAGDEDALLERVRRALAVSQAMSYDGSLHAHILGCGMQSFVLMQAAMAIDEIDLSEGAINGLLEAIDRFEVLPLRTAFEGERLAMLHLVQLTYTDHGDGDGYSIPGEYHRLETLGTEPAVLSDYLLSRFILPSRKETVEQIQSYADQVSAEADKKPADRWQHFDPMSILGNVTENQPILYYAPGPFDLSSRHDTAHRVVRNGVQVLLRIAQFRSRFERLPESLMEVEEMLDIALPRDPIRDEPFVYRILDQPDEHGRRILLYSTGHDGVDDGGAMPTGDDLVGEFASITQPRSTGFDFVINQPRQPWPEGLDEGE